MVGASAAWAVVEWLGHHLPNGYSPYQVVWTRYGVHLLAMLAIVHPRAALWRTERPGLQWLRSSCMIGMPVCFIKAVEYLPAPQVWAVFWIAPLITMAVAERAMGERLDRWSWVAAVSALAGAWVLLASGFNASLRGLFLAGAMAAFFAAYQILTRLLGPETLSSKLFYTAAGVFLALTPALPGIWRTPDALALVVMVAIGLVGLAVLYFIDRALEGVAVSGVAPFAYAQVLFAWGIERSAQGAWPHPRDLVGVSLLALGLGLGGRDGRRRSMRT
jgi:drug/metabolite transporter (DMT)-like permease